MAWETAKPPLYALWLEGAPGEIDFAVLRCMGGDVPVSSVVLAVALLLTRSWG